MKNILPFFLCAILFFSCENTEVQVQNNKMIGFVYVELLRIHESGVVLGKYYASYYLSGIKVELLKNEKVVATTYTIEDTTTDIVYLFENIELNVPYKIRITLNEDFIDTTEEFTVSENDTLFIPDSTEDTPEWLKSDKYYYPFSKNMNKDIVFNLYTDRQYPNDTNSPHLIIFPTPFIESGSLEYSVKNSGNIEIDLYDIKKTFIKTIYSGYNQPGKHFREFGNVINNGLYFVKIVMGDKSYYCPFIKGLKGSPKKP